MATSAEYNAAVEAHNEALRIYETAVAKFRMSALTKEVGEEFDAARAAKKAADAAFDVAFEIEANREEIEEVEEDTQIAFAL